MHNDRYPESPYRALLQQLLTIVTILAIAQIITLGIIGALLTKI